jgi:hypothetical protein
MWTSCRGENLPGVSWAGGGDARGRRFLLEDTVMATSLFILLLWVKALDPLGSGGGDAHGCHFLLEGAVLEPMVCLSVNGGVCFGDEASWKRSLRRWCTHLGVVQRLLVRRLGL